MPTGVTVSETGRIFVNYPRWGDPVPFTVAELKDGQALPGFDANSLDKELGLREQGYTALVVAGLGYRGESDFNAALPKSRLTREQVFTFL